MKVAIVGPSTRFLSGISYFTIRLSNALAEFAEVKAILFREMLPKILFPGWKRVGKGLTSLKFGENVEVHEILDWYNPLTWLKAVEIARKADAVILEWWTSSVAHMYLAIELLMGKKPIIIEFHEVVDPFEHSILPIRAYSRVMGWAIREFAAHFVVHSEADREIISRIYGIKREKIAVIPHGIYDHYEKLPKEEARASLGIKEDFVILFFGLLRPYKGVKYLLRAFERLPEEIAERSRLLIVGETWEDKEAVQLAMRSERRERISVVARYVSDAEVALFFSAADVLVVPYTRASQSGVAHIGMSFGMPIIASDVGGLRESLRKYAGTRFVQPRSVPSLRDALVDVFKHRREYEPPEDLRWESVARKWCELLTELKREREKRD